MHMHQLQKQHSLPQTRLLTSAMLNGYKIPAVQNTLHVPCTLTCTTDQALLTTQPFTYKTNNIWHTQHAAINFHMCTHFQYAMHCTPKFNYSTQLLSWRSYHCSSTSCSFVYCHFVYLTFLLLFAVVTHTLLKFKEQLNVLWNILAIRTSLQLSKSTQLLSALIFVVRKLLLNCFFCFCLNTHLVGTTTPPASSYSQCQWMF